MDDEFGVSELIGAEFQGKKQPPQPSYTATDLTGIKIQHKDDTFKEGRDIVLTLKDSAVLDEDNGDVLVNVNMIDDEHASRNVQLKKGLPGYIPYEEEFDEYGNVSLMGVVNGCGWFIQDLFTVVVKCLSLKQGLIACINSYNIIFDLERFILKVLYFSRSQRQDLFCINTMKK